MIPKECKFFEKMNQCEDAETFHNCERAHGKEDCEIRGCSFHEDSHICHSKDGRPLCRYLRSAESCQEHEDCQWFADFKACHDLGYKMQCEDLTGHNCASLAGCKFDENTHRCRMRRRGHDEL